MKKKICTWLVMSFTIACVLGACDSAATVSEEYTRSFSTEDKKTETELSAEPCIPVEKSGWQNNKYYKDGIIQKGLQKINGKWYLFDKYTGEKQQEGDSILFGAWHDYERSESTRFFISLDGYNFIYVPDFGEVRGRHMSFYAENGTFYGLKIMVRNVLRNVNNPVDFPFDFAIRATVNFTDDIYLHDEGLDPLVPNEKWQWHFIDGAFVDGSTLGLTGDDYSIGRGAPEWFIEGNRKYVFYAVDIELDDEVDYIGNRNYAIYRTEMKTLNNNDEYRPWIIEYASEPVQMKFDKMPKHPEDASKIGFYHPYVTKEDSTYVMFVKDETDGDIERGGCIWVYTSDDMTNWSFKYVVSDEALQHTATTRTDPVTGIMDFDENGEPALFQRYYQAPCAIKIGDTWHLYVEEQTYRIPDVDENIEDDKFSGKIVHLTSNDIFSNSWKNEGYVNVGNNRVRGASILVVDDEMAENTIQSIFNGDT